MPTQSKCQQYASTEISLETISNLSFEELGQRPFRWQLEATVAILTGNDLVLDVGTGCGKSLCFSLPLLLNKNDISLTVSPLTALMIDQASAPTKSCLIFSYAPKRPVRRRSRPLPFVKKLYLGWALSSSTRYDIKYFLHKIISNLSQDIVQGTFRQVIVSPEIATSAEFHRAVTSKIMFTDRLRVVNIDEAHCINIWGGSFRPDYADLGILRGRIPKNVPFLLASATLPDHVLDDIRLKLRLPTKWSA